MRKFSRLTQEKQELQDNNKKLIEVQFRMKNEIEIYKVKNMELSKQLEQLQLMAKQESEERESAADNMMRVVKEMEGQTARFNH